MPLQDEVKVCEDKKDSILIKFIRSFRIGRKHREKDPITPSCSGLSQLSQRSDQKSVSLVSAQKPKKDVERVHLAEYEKASAKEIPTSLAAKLSKEKSLLDVGKIDSLRFSGISDLSDKKAEIENEQLAKDTVEQLRLYREIHEVRKHMILQEKRFQDENLEFFKLQLEAEKLFGLNMQD